MQQLIRFGVVGVFNTLVGYGVIFTAMYGLGFSPATANAIGYGVGLMVSYWLHRIFTFKSKSTVRSEAFKFVTVFGIAYLINLTVLLVWTKALGLHEGVGQLVAGASYVISSYMLNKYFVFQRTRQPS